MAIRTPEARESNFYPALAYDLWTTAAQASLLVAKACNSLFRLPVQNPTRDEMVAQMLFPGASVRIGEDGQEKYVLMDDIKSGRINSGLPSTMAEYREHQERTGHHFVLNTILPVFPERIETLIRLMNGNPKNPAHERWARQMICFGDVSAGLWFMGKDQGENAVMPLFLYHQANEIYPAGNGIIACQMKVTEIGKSSLTVDYSQIHQEAGSHPTFLGRGTDKVVFDAYDPNKVVPTPVPEKWCSNEPVHAFYEQLMRSAPPVDFTGFSAPFSSRLIMPDDLTLFSEVLGDHSRGHLEYGFMQGTRYGFPHRISLGQALVACAGRELVDLTGQKITGGRAEFHTPHVPGVARTQNWFRLNQTGCYNYMIVDPDRKMRLASGYFNLN